MSDTTETAGEVERQGEGHETSPVLSFTVHGTPAPQGSKRHVGRGIMVESSKAVKPWREAVKWAALEALRTGPEDEQGMAERVGYPFGGEALHVHVVFVLPRPKAHYRSGKHSHELRPDAPYLVMRKPDIDKLLRSTLDALGEAAVFVDDSQVAVIGARKVYAGNLYGQPGARISVQVATP